MKSISKQIVYFAIFTALIIVGGFIVIPIPYVPITLQTFFIFLTILVLKNKSFISVGAYIVLGLIGVPVFAMGGGFSYVFYPTFGYLIGFFVCSLVLGQLLSRKKYKFSNTLIKCFVCHLIVYLFGVVYFYFVKTFYIGDAVSAKILLLNCFLFTLPGDLVFIYLANIINQRILLNIKV